VDKLDKKLRKYKKINKKLIKINKKYIKKINKEIKILEKIGIVITKKIKTPIFIKNSHEDYTMISRVGDFNMYPLLELSEKDKQIIEKFMEENIKNKVN